MNCKATTLVALVLGLSACGGRPTGPSISSSPSLGEAPAPATRAKPYIVSPQGGTPATGPGERFNRCERIWCLAHGENFFIDHFLQGHIGWIIHDDLAGDVFVPRRRTEGPEFPHAKLNALLLCGAHVHPYLLGKRGGPVRDGYYSHSMGYSRAHFRAYGTRLDPCCINGMGSDYIHAADGRRIRFHDLSEYRANPTLGWQKPFQGTVTPPT